MVSNSEHYDVMSILLDLREEFQNSAPNSEEFEFITRLCQSIDQRNILSEKELQEFECMEIAGKVIYGKELEDAISEYFLCSFQDIVDDIDEDSINKELQLADVHIALIGDITNTVLKEYQHVKTGMHQLQQQEKAAHYNLLEVGQRCEKFHQEALSLQEDLLNHLLEISDTNKSEAFQQLATQIPVQDCKKKCTQLDRLVKTLMHQHFEENEPCCEYYEDKILEDLEHSSSELKMECLYIEAFNKGKNAAIRKLNEIANDFDASKVLPSVNELRNKCLVLETIVSSERECLGRLMETEALAVLKLNSKMEVADIQNLKNEYELTKLQGSVSKLSIISKCLETALVHANMFVLMQVIQRQDLENIDEMLDLCHADMIDECSQFGTRMKCMQEIKESLKDISIMENPMLRSLLEILSEYQSFEPSNVISYLLPKLRNLEFEIKTEEGKLLGPWFNQQRHFLLQKETAIRSIDNYLYPSLLRKPLLQNVELTHWCSSTEHLMESLNLLISKVKEELMRQQLFFKHKPLQKEQNLLWVLFLTDPKTLVAKVQELERMKQQKKKKTYLHLKK